MNISEIKERSEKLIVAIEKYKNGKNKIKLFKELHKARLKYVEQITPENIVNIIERIENIENIINKLGIHVFNKYTWVGRNYNKEDLIKDLTYD